MHYTPTHTILTSLLFFLTVLVTVRTTTKTSIWCCLQSVKKKSMIFILMFANNSIPSFSQSKYFHVGCKNKQKINSNAMAPVAVGAGVPWWRPSWRKLRVSRAGWWQGSGTPRDWPGHTLLAVPGEGYHMPPSGDSCKGSQSTITAKREAGKGGSVHNYSTCNFLSI